jgi:hypothetical protein
VLLREKMLADGEGVGGWTQENRMVKRGTEEKNSTFSDAKQGARGNPELSNLRNTTTGSVAIYTTRRKL